MTANVATVLCRSMSGTRLVMGNNRSRRSAGNHDAWERGSFASLSTEESLQGARREEVLCG
ncbi:hypothetical protein L3H50_00770 [Corynebacterium sp. MC-04]|uniref:Uncharacterized protein n=1 Tax=Corynebacterium parakroppenstedtii TaxID=2828363 RepID=A0ABS9HIG2_9CORY|nr:MULTISPECIES: hypothetical protein [Corynebacterium]MDU3197236.1 hypothetical protein [Corynebacterium kroppenstedtii]MBY0788203.1 hypothetical protein [Corynebacterium parakroppenstedtii]MBY0792279.1 hypothetical protein [Corynebacterium parakroppenstedtii]MBY0795964.1 hypothetical protein [Corynebacterium parakroppenstedtii]MCF6769229.1 hypothetical protein [Corynebacterium parakroppenstedtii]